jgi:aquaporin NIP
VRRKLVAEWLGTFILMFAGTGACIVNHLTGSITHVGVALTFGLVVMALIYTFGHISGAHFNPAVTIAFMIYRTISVRDGLLYILVQIFAALCASLTLRLMFGNVADLGATIPRESWQQSFIMEIILTFILMIVIYGSALHTKAVHAFAGVSIGAVVALEAMFAGPISGASMNPARSLAPAMVSGNLEHLWIYLTATVIGAVIATYVFKWLAQPAATQS